MNLFLKILGEESENKSGEDLLHDEEDVDAADYC